MCRALDEIERLARATRRIGDCNVKGIPGQREQGRVRNLFLPRPRVRDRREAAFFGGDDERGTLDAGEVVGDVPAGYRLDEAELGGYGCSSHQLRPPFVAFAREARSETASHR